MSEYGLRRKMPVREPRELHKYTEGHSHLVEGYGWCWCEPHPPVEYKVLSIHIHAGPSHNRGKP